MEEQVEILTLPENYYRSIGMPKANSLHLLDVGEHIILHKTHSFDKHGKVIVVDGDREDIWQEVAKYQDEVGPKNVIRLIEAGADAQKLLTANSEAAVYGDFTEFEAKSINELGDRVPDFAANAQKALDNFNKQFGTSLDMKSFIDLYNKGLLQAHVEGVNTVKGENTDGKE